MKHKVLGYIFIFAVIAATVSVLYFQQVKQESLVNVPTSVHKDLAANWKTYTNTKYGFEFKYPQNWVVQESQNLIQISDTPLVTDSGNIFSVSMGSGTYRDESESSVDWKEGQLVFGGSSFFKKLNFNGKNVSIGMSANNAQIMKIEDQILSTFKFTK